jgi:glycosyltransferase involved in cell wall biosynthesis
MGTSHRVTVLIPVYNREKYVAAAIESILTKSFIDFEILLIDDGSTDGSVKILRSHTT